MFHNGKRFYNAVLKIYYLPNKNIGLRVGIVVSKRVGNAVKRNTIKRRLREALRRLKPEDNFNAQASYDIVLVAKPVIVKEPFSDIFNGLSDFFKKNLFKKHAASIKDAPHIK